MTMLDAFPYLDQEVAQADARRLIMARGLKAHPHFVSLIEADSSPVPWLGDLVESLDHKHLAHGTPYFWRFLRQVLTVRTPGPAMDAALHQLAFAALDLAVGEPGLERFGELSLPPAGELQLLRCGISRIGGAPPSHARFVGGGFALSFVDGSTLRADAPSAPCLSPPLRTIALTCVDLGKSIEQVERDEASISRLRGVLVEAFRWIENLPGPVVDLISQEARFVSPLRRGPSVHFSFTLSDLPGMIFVGDADNVLTIVEAIVHETAHARLHHANERYVLSNDAAGAAYYSPWRGDPRPAAGVLHGAYVFSLVLAFWIDALERAHMTDAQRVYVAGRVAAVRTQLALAFQVLSKADLSEFGRDLLSRLASILPEVEGLVGALVVSDAHAVAEAKIARARVDFPELVMP